MAKFSKLYKVGDKSFRYNYDQRRLEYFSKPGKDLLAQMKDDNERWLSKFGRPLWSDEEIAGLVDSIGCFLEDWKDDPVGCCQRYADMIDEEMAYALKDLEGELGI